MRLRPETHLVELLRWRAAEERAEAAYVFLANGERELARLTFRDLDRAARSTAAALQERHLAGERALLLYPPGLDFIARAARACPGRHRRRLFRARRRLAAGAAPHLQAVGRICGVTVPLGALFAQPTVAGLAAFVEGLRPAQGQTVEAPDLERLVAEVEGPTEEEVELLLGAERPAHGGAARGFKTMAKSEPPCVSAVRPDYARLVSV